MKSYPVACMFCTSAKYHGKKIRRTHFDVTFGAHAFFLCKKHQKTLQDFIDEHEGN